MPYTWLQLGRAVAAEMGLGSIPASVAGATDDQTRQIGALANRCGEMLLRNREWTALQTEWNISVAAPIDLTGNVTSGSVTVTGIASTAGLLPGRMAVLGDAMTQATRLASVVDINTVTLTQPATFTATGAALSFCQDVYEAPVDMLAPINRTFWDRSRRWELIGPMSPQEDEWMRSGIVATGPRRRFRFIGRGQNVFRIWPPPGALDSPAALAFEYISAHWATAADGTPKDRFTADADTCVFADDLMLMGVKWLWLQSKGMEYAAFRDDWMRQVEQAEATDGASPTLDMARGRWPILIGPGNVPDTGFGS
jgi:hypothetical protein